MTDNTIRLAKRVAEMMPCSRAEADKYIAGGWVSVDGQVVEEAGARVADDQEVALHPDATLVDLAPVTILLHKPAGFNAGMDNDGESALSCLTQEALVLPDHGNQRFLKRHLSNLTLASPLETKASGLVIYTQDFRVARKLVDEGARVEQESGLMNFTRVLHPGADAAQMLEGLDGVRKRSYSTWDLLVWTRDLDYLRRGPAFQQYIADTGILGYWRQHGFPPQCRPLGPSAECR